MQVSSLLVRLPQGNKTGRKDSSNARSKADGASSDVEKLQYASREELIQSLLEEDLESLSPERGVKMFLEQKSVQSSTREDYKRKLHIFLTFFEGRGKVDLNEISSLLISEYKLWRKENAKGRTEELSAKTLRDEFYLLREFVSHLERKNVVKSGVSDEIDIPPLPAGAGVRDEELAPERAEEIKAHLVKFEYASRDHVVWILWCETGCRISGLRALDLDDANLDCEEPSLTFKHRPGTPLKNDRKSERVIILDQRTAEVLRDYISQNRHAVRDEHGREPLITTRHGRISGSTLRKIAYDYTRPCEINKGCPHGRDPASCEAAQDRTKASKCPSSCSPHVVRHGVISEARRQGVPLEALSGRVDASAEVIEEHYDETTPEERARARKKRFDERRSDEGGYL